MVLEQKHYSLNVLKLTYKIWIIKKYLKIQTDAGGNRKYTLQYARTYIHIYT